MSFQIPLKVIIFFKILDFRSLHPKKYENQDRRIILKFRIPKSHTNCWVFLWKTYQTSIQWKYEYDSGWMSLEHFGGCFDQNQWSDAFDRSWLSLPRRDLPNIHLGKMTVVEWFCSTLVVVLGCWSLDFWLAILITVTGVSTILQLKFVF